LAPAGALKPVRVSRTVGPSAGRSGIFCRILRSSPERWSVTDTGAEPLIAPPGTPSAVSGPEAAARGRAEENTRNPPTTAIGKRGTESRRSIRFSSKIARLYPILGSQRAPEVTISLAVLWSRLKGERHEAGFDQPQGGCGKDDDGGQPGGGLRP